MWVIPLHLSKMTRSGLSRLTSAIAADKFSKGIVAGTSPRADQQT